MSRTGKQGPAVARAVLRGGGAEADEHVELTYEGRFLRRRRLVTDKGVAVLVDLPDTTSLEDGDALLLEDGRKVAVAAADEDLAVVTGPDLARLAWHIGNRHTPCRIEAGRLMIARDHVLEAMIGMLGGSVAAVREPFRPEGGAYGHGRTMGHDHGPVMATGPGGHAHGPDDGHDHGDAHRSVHHHGSHHGLGEAGSDAVDGDAG